jgi:hypothetical protein
VPFGGEAAAAVDAHERADAGGLAELLAAHAGRRARKSVTGRAAPARRRFAHDERDADVSAPVAARTSTSSRPWRA